MSKQRMQRWRVAPPKTISIKVFKDIVESLDGFMLGLVTIERSIETMVVANGEQLIKAGPDSWTAYQPFALDKIEHVQVELTLKQNEQCSCQLHVEFRRNHIFLSVSDIGTGWIDAVFEKMERKLQLLGLFKGELGYKLTSAIVRLQNIFLFAGTFLILLPSKNELDFFYVGISLIITGLIPGAADIFRIFFPQKPTQVLEEKLAFPILSFEKAAIWVGFVSGVVSLGKELFILIFQVGG